MLMEVIVQHKTLTGIAAILLLISGSIFGECKLPASFDSKSMKDQIRYLDTRTEQDCLVEANALRKLQSMANTLRSAGLADLLQPQSEQSTRELADLILEIRGLEKEIDEIERWIRYSDIANTISNSKSCGADYRNSGPPYRKAKQIIDDVKQSGGKWTQAKKDEVERYLQIHTSIRDKYRQCFEEYLPRFTDVTSRGIDTFAKFELAYRDLRERHGTDTDVKLSSKKVKLKGLNERRVFLLRDLGPKPRVVKDDKPDEKTVKPNPDIPWESLDDDEVEQPELPCVGVLGMTGEECG